MEQTDHDALKGYDIDEDYIDVEPESVEISIDENDLDQKESDDKQIPPPYRDVDLSHTFGRHEGGGSGTAVDDAIDTREASERDDRGGDTGMDISDAEGHYGERIIREGKTRTRAEWLQLLNNGYRASEYDTETYEADKERWLDIICSRVDVSPHQKSETKHVLESLELNEFGGRPYTVEIIILSALSLTTQKDGRMVREERAYRKIVADLDQNMKTIRRCRDMIKEKSDLWDD